MSLTIQLPVEDESRLADKAKIAGLDVATYVQRILKAEASRPAIEEILKPIRDAFRNSGMSEIELSDLLIKAKKQMRADRKSHGEK